MRLKVCSSFVFLLLIGHSLLAQYQLSGQIKDQITGQPIASAQVILKESGAFQATDSKGYFLFSELEKGHYTLVIFSYQYQTLTVPVGIDGDTEVTFNMEELSQELSEVIINQKKEEIFGLKRLQAVEGTAIYAGKKTEVVLLDNMVGNRAANNARQVYAQVVGLNIYESNDGGLQLSIGGRGLDPNRTANFNTRQNGYDISADVLGYPESYYTPPIEGLEEIEVIRGAASLQYGTQFGGLINFKMKKPVADQKISLNSRQTIGSFGLFTSFNSLSGTVGKFSYYTYVNYKQGDGYRPNSGFQSINYFGNFNYQLNEKTKLSFDYTYLNYLAQQAGGLTDEQFETDPKFSNRERNWFSVNWNLFNLRWDQKIGKQTDWSLSLFGLNASRYAVGFRGIPGADGLGTNPVSVPDYVDEQGNYIYTRDLMKGRFANWGAEGRLLHRYELLGRKSVFLIGSKYYHANNTAQQGPGSNDKDADFRFDFDNHPDYSNQSDFKFPNRNLAFFGENVLFLNDKLSITPGVRLEHINTRADGEYYNQQRDEFLVDQQNLERNFVLLGLGISQEFKPNLELYGNISQNYRSVTFSDIRTVSPTFQVDSLIQDESGYTADIGLRGRFNDLVSYDLGVYSLMYRDRIGILLDDRANRVRTNIGDAMIYGAEMLVELNLAGLLGMDQSQTRLAWFINNAFTQSQYISADQGNNNVKGNQVEFIPLINLKSGINGGYKNLRASLQFSYLSEQYTDAQNSTVEDSNDIRSGVIGQIPSYHIMDFSLSYKYKFMRFESGINNLTDNSYFTRRATGYPGPGIIPSDGRSFYFTLGIQI